MPQRKKQPATSNVGGLLYVLLFGGAIGAVLQGDNYFSVMPSWEFSSCECATTPAVENAAPVQETDVPKKPLQRQTRTLQAVLGMDVTTQLLDSLDGLRQKQTKLHEAIDALEVSLDQFATASISALPIINVEEAKKVFSKSGPPSIHIKQATYGQPNGERADVKWLLQKYVFNSVLRLPAGYSVLSLFGSKPKFEKGSDPYTLQVEAETIDGAVSVQVATPDGKLEKDLVVSSARPTQLVERQPVELTAELILHLKGKKGLEIGGPTKLYQERDIYKSAESVDLVNFSEKTLWGTFKHGSVFDFEGGGSGKVHITDGSTLQGIPNSSYDFAMGSHYLEHLINPLRALSSMLRVLKPGGIVVLVLPRKEACFDHPRGTTRLEDVLHRYIRVADETDMQYSNFEEWNLQIDLDKAGRARTGNVEQLRARSVRFVDNRGIHTTVWDFELMKQAAAVLNCELVFQSVENDLDQWNILRKRGGSQEALYPQDASY